jgi:hypothetical protein
MIMTFLRLSLIAICAAASTVLAASLPRQYAGPTVTLDKGEFIGTTANGINEFLGIPFAQPPSVIDSVHRSVPP